MLALLLAAALVAPGADIPLTEPNHAPAIGWQTPLAAASDGDGYLVVWSDGRTGVPALRTGRVSGDGEVREPAGTELPFSANQVDMIWTGESYLAVAAQTSFGYPLRLVELDRDGRLLRDTSVLHENGVRASIATNGPQIVVGTLIDRMPHALFLSRDGTVLRRVRLSDSTAASDAGTTVVWNRNAFVAIWAEPGSDGRSYRLQAVRFSAGGVVDAEPIALFDTFDPPAVDVDDEGNLVIVVGNASRFVSADFGFISAPVILPGIWNQLVWVGPDYKLGGVFDGKPARLALDRTGRPLNARPVVVDQQPLASFGRTLVATNGRGALYAWDREVPAQPRPSSDLYGAIEGRDPFVLTTAAAPQSNARLASSGKNLLVVWREDDRIFARRFTNAGVPIDPSPAVVPGINTVAGVAFTGAVYLISGQTWPGANRAVLLRAPADGPLGIEEVISFDEESPLGVASDGRTTLLAGSDRYRLLLRRLRADGTPFDAEPLTVGTYPRAVAMASDGHDFLVVWTHADVDYWGEAEFGRAIHATRVTEDLQASDERDSIRLSSARFANDPSVSWNGSEWLVVWSQDGQVIGRTCAVEDQRWFGTMSGERVLLDRGTSPSVAWDGSQFVLAWTTTENPRMLEVGTLADAGAPVIADGTLGTAAAGSESVSFAASPRGLAAAITRRDDEAAGGVSRSFLRVVSPAAPRRRALR